MGLEELYQEIILDHYKKPRHPGRLEDDRVEVRHYNPVCGDELTLGLRLDGDRVGEIAVDGKGCSISQASASVMTELVVGRTVDEAMQRAEAFRRLLHGDGEPDEELLEDGIAFAGVARYPVRVKCALLGWMAFKDATARALAGQHAPSETVYGEEEDENAIQAARGSGRLEHRHVDDANPRLPGGAS